MQSPQQYETFKANAQAKIRELQSEIEKQTGATLKVGTEIELMTADIMQREIDKAAVLARLQEDFPEVTEFKVEGPAFCAYKVGVWDSVDSQGLYPNNDGRFFIPDRPADTVTDNNVPPRILRWEILTHENVSAERAAQVAEEVQPAIGEILRDMYPSIRVTSRPKIMTDIEGIIDVEAAIKYLKGDEARKVPARIPADSEAKTLDDLEVMHGIRVVPQIPGMGMQRNYSLFKDGQNIFNGAQRSDEFSDVAWQVLAGLNSIAKESVAGFLGTKESYHRSARVDRSAIQEADDLTQCKPEKVALMHTDARKFESFPFMLRPYSAKATDSISGMTNDPARVASAGGKANYGRKESDIRGGKYDRVEVRITDCVSDQWLQSMLELAAIKYGLQQFAGQSREEIQAEFAKPDMQRRVGDCFADELHRFKESDVIRNLLGTDLYLEACEHLNHQALNRSRGDDGLKAYCQTPPIDRYLQTR